MIIDTPYTVTTEFLATDHVDEYDVDLVRAGMREFHDLLSDTARALERAITRMLPEERGYLADTLTDIEEALAVLEERA